MAEWGERPLVTAADVTAARARLRRSSPHERVAAVGELRSWQGSPLGPEAATEALRAATVGYPWVAESADDVGELLVQLLWADPFAVGAADLERAYVFCGERARRAILRTLALRADLEALDVVAHLIGPDGPSQLVPVPTNDLLRPLLVVPGVERLAPSLATLAWRRGWAGHAGELLGDMIRRGLLDEPVREAVTGELSRLVCTLVDTCDRGWANGSAALARVERERLGALVPAIAALPGDRVSATLRRVLAAADPRVAASAVVALLSRGEAVGEDRIELLARDPEARGVLLAGLGVLGRGTDLPRRRRTDLAMAEADVVRWLASAAELGTGPDEIEHRGAVTAPATWGRGLVHVFAFRVRPPHWCAERDWMLAAAGPFDADAGDVLPSPATGYAVHSLYASEDGDDLGRHVLAISEAVVAARGHDAA